MDRQIKIEMKVKFIPLPPEREPVWRAGLLLLIHFMTGECNAAEPVQIQDFISMEVAHE